jgi:pimeloyl-ACP methyl ester carboxylesterase
VNSSYIDRSIACNGMTLHYQDWESAPGAKPVLMVHGVTMQSHAFDPVAKLLGSRYHCLALDLRGHGDSQWSEAGQYTTLDYVHDVRAFLDTLQIEKVHYIGTSLGGRVGMAFASRYADRLASLVLNDITPIASSEGRSRILQTMATAAELFPTLEAYVERVLFAYVPSLRAVPMEAVARGARWHLRKAPGGFRVKFDPRVLQILTNQPLVEQELLWDGLRKAECPLLLLRGEQSDIVTREAVQSMRQAKPEMKFVEVPGVGHAPALVERISQTALSSFFV